MPSAQDYKFISREALDEMLNAPGVGVGYRPLGMFLCIDEIDGEWVYTAVDNRDGQALTEDFVTKRSAVRWLHGHPVADEQIWKPKNERVSGARRMAQLAAKEKI